MDPSWVGPPGACPSGLYASMAGSNPTSGDNYMGKGCGPLKRVPFRDIPWMFLTEIFGVMEFINIDFTHIFCFLIGTTLIMPI